MNIKKLKALAEDASPGQWDVKDGFYPSFKKIVGPAFSLKFCWFAYDISQEQSRQRIADAEYIAAANPAVLLELVGQYELLLNALAEIQHYSPVGSTCYEIATRAINAMEDDQ